MLYLYKNSRRTPLRPLMALNQRIERDSEVALAEDFP
jgi:hypothetical protein